MPGTQKTGAKTMGADPHDPNTGEVPVCETGGNDVVIQLNDVFSDPKSDKYRQAQANNQFGTVGTDYNVLISAYVSAGLNVNGRWRAYLRKLASIDLNNISDIAGFRDSHLKSGQGMTTTIHKPIHGGHVQVDPGVIDSPFPLPDKE
jgi:hypothetical protein